MGTTYGVALTLLLSPVCEASWAEEPPKRTLRLDMTEVYHAEAPVATKVSEIFTKAEFFGRARVNFFKHRSREDLLHNPTGFGLGGSVIVRTAPFHGISATAGLYTSQNLGLLEKDDALFGRAGKDTFSRYDVLTEDKWGMTVLAQSYLEYRYRETYIRAGRQIFESFPTRSNDTKMIPNTFMGYTLVSRDIPSTTLTLAYLTRQKLRDHTRFHDVLTFGDGTDDIPTSLWTNNDDAGVHRGLSYSNLEAAGRDVSHHLVVAGVSNESVPNLKLDLWYTGVPGSFSWIMVEPNYRIELRGGWSLVPGIRYMQQFDDGAGAVGGAALLGTLAGMSGPAGGYREAESVAGKLYAARLLLLKGAGRILAGYSRISDDADFIAPWRGFPTVGYTRTMAQTNWHADTRSWLVAAFYDFGAAGPVRGLRVLVDYAVMDYDDEKERLGGMLKTDRSSIHADIWYAFPSLPFLEARARVGLVQAERLTAGPDPSYNEFRLELNWLF